MKIFEFNDYKSFFNERVQTVTKRKSGVLSVISKKYRIPNSTLSQVFNGTRHLTPEQALDISEFLQLNVVETDYFCMLVDFDRAGNEKLKNRLSKKLASIRFDQQKLKNVVSDAKVLSDSAKFQFYSDWTYTAVHLLSSLPNIKTVSDISQYLNLSEKRTQDIVKFLSDSKMIEINNDKISIGKISTIIEAEDPLVYRHHQNWRSVSARKLAVASTLLPHELCITWPCSTNRNAMKQIKKNFMDFVEASSKTVSDSSEECVAYINFDLFELNKIQGKP